MEALGNAGDRRAVPLLVEVVRDSASPVPARSQAIRALAGTEAGAAELLKAGEREQAGWDAGLRTTAARALAQARWPTIREAAGRVFPVPRLADGAPLPGVVELSRRKGDPARGAGVFRSEKAGCIKCHRVEAEGVDFGPALSQIGGKLGKEALYEAILEPSAGISFGFEGWDFELRGGDTVSGRLASETAEELAVKQPAGVVVRVPKATVVRRVAQPLSVMPAGLGELLTVEELVDLVEYLTTLRGR